MAIDLKVGPFRPEYVGKMNFYLSTIDDLLLHPDDEPSIGLILCKDRNSIIVEYALRDTNKPIGVSRYKLSGSLPKAVRGLFPSVEDLEAELAGKAGLARAAKPKRKR